MLEDTYSEMDLEAAILRELERFLLGLDRYERRPGEGPPIGQILCGEKNRGEIRVAEYLVELPPREMLEAKLYEAIQLARGQVEWEARKPLKGDALVSSQLSNVG